MDSNRIESTKIITIETTKEPLAYNPKKTISDWDLQSDRFDEQVTAFTTFVSTKKVENIDQDEDIDRQLKDINRIYEVVKEAVSKLKELTPCMTDRCKKLSSSRNNRVMTTLNIVTKCLGCVGGIVALQQENTTLRTVASCFLSAAFVFDGFAYYKDRKAKKETDELDQLQARNNNKVEQAEKFLKFLEELHILQNIGIKNLRSKNYSPSKENQRSIIDTDTRIDTDTSTKPWQIAERVIKCLKQFDEQATVARSKETYDAIVNIIGKSLPQEDPLRIALEEVSHKKAQTPVLSYKNVSLGPKIELSEESFMNDKQIDNKGTPWDQSEGNSGGDELVESHKYAYSITELPPILQYLSVIHSFAIVKT
jgi:hypothetical protein